MVRLQYVDFNGPVYYTNERSILIGPKVVIRGGADCLVLHRCFHVRMSDVRCCNPNTSRFVVSGKGILLDKCRDVTLENISVTCDTPSGDGINLFRCRHVLLRNIRISGPKRKDDVDIAAGVVIDVGCKNVRVEDIRCTNIGSAASVVVLGRNHVLANVSGVIQIGLDTECDVSDVVLLRCRNARIWVSPFAQRIRYGTTPLKPGTWTCDDRGRLVGCLQNS